MSVEVELLVQEAKESIEAAQNYRSELQQRLQGLSQARKQVRAAAAAAAAAPPDVRRRPCSHLRALRSFCHTPPSPPTTAQTMLLLPVSAAKSKMEEVKHQ